MNTYALSALNDKEFEALAADLLGTVMGSRIERFKVGKDKGVDGRWFISKGDEGIVQCKHWSRSGFKALLKYMIKTEKPKIERLAPARYILFTSVELSRIDKKALFQQLSPYVVTETDIYGSEDIHDLLALNPTVEQRHYKLWLTSASALSHIFNNAISGRSHFEAENIRSRLSRFIKTDDFDRALSLLSKRHAVIITGAPGIGKTTLAEQLLIHLAANGFDLVSIREISEAESVYSNDARQVFYFDDFLGRNMLEALRPNFDSHVGRFINRVRSDKAKRFVLTSRSNILNQAKHLTDVFDLEKTEKNEYEVRLEDLTKLDKARILYSHVWHSDMPDEILSELFAEKRYKAIINHRNFNPRLMSFITDNDKDEVDKSENYWGYVTKTLENPQGIWSHFFTSQLSQQCRDMVYLVVINRSVITETQLLAAFRLTRSDVDGNSGSIAHKALVALKICVGSVLNRRLDARTGNVTYELYNPSIADYVLWTIKDWAAYSLYFMALRSRSMLQTLTHLLKAKFVSSESYNLILEGLAHAELERSIVDPDSYSAELAGMLITEESFRQKYPELIRVVVNGIDFAICGDCYVDLIYLMTYALMWKLVDEPESRVMDLVGALGNWPFGNGDMSMLATLMSEVSGEGKNAIEQAIRRFAKEWWNDNIRDFVSEADLLKNIYSEQQYPQAIRELSESISEELKGTGFEFTPEDVDEICKSLDLDRIVERNTEWPLDDDETPRAPVSRPVDVDDQMIEDLFEKADR